MGISLSKKKMSQGRIQPGAYKFTNSEWNERTTNNGKDIVDFKTVFEDADGESHPTSFLLGDQKYVRVEDGKLTSADQDRDYQVSLNSPCGKLFSSLEECGFNTKKLDKLGDEPGLVDDQWVQIDVKGSGRKNEQTGQEYTDVIVTELLDGPPSGSSKSKSKKAASKKAKDEDEGDEEGGDENEEESDDDEDEDPVTAAADKTLQTILKSPAKYVKGYDEDEGGITMKQAASAAFTAYKGDAKLKGKASKLLSDKDYLKAASKREVCSFDSKTGIISAAE